MKISLLQKWAASISLAALVLAFGFVLYAAAAKDAYPLPPPGFLKEVEGLKEASQESAPLISQRTSVPSLSPSIEGPLQESPSGILAVSPVQVTRVQATVVSQADLESLIGAFPYKNEKPAVFPHWRLVPERKSIELYASREFISSQVFSLARFVGDIDRGSKKQDVVDQGQIKGFVYSASQIVTWANQEYDRLDRDEKSLVRELVSLGVLKQESGANDNISRVGFVWNPSYENWPINAYSSAGVFRHERVHVLWLKKPQFKEYFIKQWNEQTKGLSRQAKIGFVLEAFEQVPYNRPPGYAWWNTVYSQVGEEDVVNEFTAHSIEKLPEWRNRTLPLAM